MSEDTARLVNIIIYAVLYSVTLIFLYMIFNIVNGHIEKLLKLFNLYIENMKYSGQPSTLKPDYNNTRAYAPSTSIEARDIKVEQLAPETIAPALKRPPKPAGGFGSKVSVESTNNQ